MPHEDDRDRLSADDAQILGVESAVITGHTLKPVVLEPSAGPLDIDALRTAVAKRLPGFPSPTRWRGSTGYAHRQASANASATPRSFSTSRLAHAIEGSYAELRGTAMGG
jgi:hypothetical protein